MRAPREASRNKFKREVCGKKNFFSPWNLKGGASFSSVYRCAESSFLFLSLFLACSFARRYRQILMKRRLVILERFLLPTSLTCNCTSCNFTGDCKRSPRFCIFNQRACRRKIEEKERHSHSYNIPIIRVNACLKIIII